MRGAKKRCEPGACKQEHTGNGKGMFIYYIPAASYPAQTDIAKAEFGDMVPYGPYLAIKTTKNNVVPWLASQTDLLSEDWGIVV